MRGGNASNISGTERMAFAFLYVGFQGLLLNLVWNKNPVSKSLGKLGHFIRCVTVILLFMGFMKNHIDHPFIKAWVGLEGLSAHPLPCFLLLRGAKTECFW